MNPHGQIRVPFPIQSVLSGVCQEISPQEYLVYRCELTLPRAWAPGRRHRVLLHFGAVDWWATVWVDGKRLGEHRGGFTPFTLDATEALAKACAGSHDAAVDGVIPVLPPSPCKSRLTVGVWDPGEAGVQWRGKQSSHTGGILYSNVTGIWQTVWLEAVPLTCHIVAVRTDAIGVVASSKRTTPEFRVEVKLATSTNYCRELHPKQLEVALRCPDGRDAGVGIASLTRERWDEHVDEQVVIVSLPLPRLQLWGPDDPALYSLEIEIIAAGGVVIDQIRSYAAAREVGVRMDSDGDIRVTLNGLPIFMLGWLDQGYWPDGLYTPPNDEAMEHDLLVAKALGFNTVRKHVKVESQRWYAACDRLGLLVWQDVPNGDRQAEWSPSSRRLGTHFLISEIDRTSESETLFHSELDELVAALGPHPCICVWVLFNEGWGQFRTEANAERIARLDPTRLINATSGGNDRCTGHFVDLHYYGEEPGAPNRAVSVDSSRVAVLGEWGGLGLTVAGHTWQPNACNDDCLAYFWCCDAINLATEYLNLNRKLLAFIRKGGAGQHLSAAIYTQATDVEWELNGLWTYDRIPKLEACALEEVRALHAELLATASMWTFTA